MTVPKMTIGGRCFKAFALGLLVARCIGHERTMEEKLTLARKNTLYGKVKE